MLLELGGTGEHSLEIDLRELQHLVLICVLFLECCAYRAKRLAGKDQNAA